MACLFVTRTGDMRQTACAALTAPPRRLSAVPGSTRGFGFLRVGQVDLREETDSGCRIESRCSNLSRRAAPSRKTRGCLPLLRTSLSDRLDLARRSVMTFDAAEIIGASVAMNDAH